MQDLGDTKMITDRYEIKLELLAKEKKHLTEELILCYKKDFDKIELYEE
jgi:hypothetical protein